HPDVMDSLVALVPLARTPAWSVLLVEATRKAIMLDPAWNNGNYTSIPVNGVRLWREILGFGAARTPEMYRDQFARPLDVLPWLKEQEDRILTPSIRTTTSISRGPTRPTTWAARPA